MTQTHNNTLLTKIQALLNTWRETGVPPRATLHQTVDDLMRWRKEEGFPGLWVKPPRMVGATLDDGWGHGIRLILQYAEAMGVETAFSGLLLTWERIVEACRAQPTDILGLTVLQLDTEDELVTLRAHLPSRTKILAGGPVFSIDPELSTRVGIDYVAKDAGEFMEILLKYFKPDSL